VRKIQSKQTLGASDQGREDRFHINERQPMTGLAGRQELVVKLGRRAGVK
jgi:hypothetical protein